MHFIKSSMQFIIIAGPCVVESYAVCSQIAETALGICNKLGFSYVFKSSFKKANRTKMGSFTGIEEAEAFEILKKIKKKYNVLVLTDVHETTDVAKVQEVADYLQIPAFLCRQTE